MSMKKTRGRASAEKSAAPEKAYYDERQKNIQLRFVIAALLIFGFLIGANNLFMENVTQWISYGNSVFVFASVAISVYIVGTAIAGSFFTMGTNGPTVTIIIVCYLSLLLGNLIPIDTANGIFMSEPSLMISFGLVAVAGVIAVIIHRAEKKREDKMSSED